MDDSRRRREIGKRYQSIWDRIAAENAQFNQARENNPIVNDLAKPECSMGYTDEQITRIMGARLYDFRKWMDGQTEAMCEDQFNPETETRESSGCGPHGIVTYRQDVERFLLGLPVVD